jgi:hypothetical protein
MNAPFDRLHADLADLAEEVTVVDLQDRVLRTSRRLGMRRALVGGAAVLAVLAAGSGTALAVLPKRHESLPPAVITSLSASPPAASPTPDSSPSAGTPSAPPTSASPAKPSATMPALYFYRDDDPDGVIKNDLLYRPVGGSWRVVSRLPGPAGTTNATQVSLSPDRQSVAWMTEDGKVQVSAEDGTGVLALTQPSPSDRCGEGITWTGDSRRIVYAQRSSAVGPTATIKVLNADGSWAHTLATVPTGLNCSVSASGDGRTVAYLDGKNNKIDLFALDGSQTHTLTPRLPHQQVLAEIIALDQHADRLLVSTLAEGGCGCSPPHMYFLIDVDSGKVTRLSQDGTASISGKFTLDGRIVFVDDLNRANGNGVVPRLTLFGPDGKVLSHATAPKFSYGTLVSVG